ASDAIACSARSAREAWGGSTPPWIPELAEAQQQRLCVRAWPDYAASLLERGRRADAEACLAAMVKLFAGHRSAATRWHLPVVRAAFALFDGDADRSE